MISVIIPVFNAGALLERCLESVLAQKGEEPMEVILVDDGSTDNSVEIISEFISKRPNIAAKGEGDIQGATREAGQAERVRFTLLRQENAGPALARNRGLAASRGEFVAFLDADDYWEPEFCERTVGFLEQHPECIAVSVAQRHLTPLGQGESPKGWRELAPEEGIVLDDFYGFWADHNHVCTGSIMILGDVARASGGQRADLRLCEDLEYWACLATMGKMGYIPQLLFTSDGSRVTAELGWVEKYLPRWRNAVPVEEWERRINALADLSGNAGYRKARGRVARNLAYNILLSKRYALAREQVRRNGAEYPRDKMSRLLRLGASNGLLWLLVSRLLVYREWHR